MKRVYIKPSNGLEHSKESNLVCTLCAYAGQVLRYLRRTLHESVDVANCILNPVTHIPKLLVFREVDDILRGVRYVCGGHVVLDLSFF